MLRFTCRLLLVLCAVIFFPESPLRAAPGFPGARKPKLIVVIVFDQFRADYLTRFQDRLGAGGFRYLVAHGAYFPFAQYDLLQSMTGPGHATILTGSYPYQAGIPINEWYDQTTHSKVYCTEDPDSPTVGATTSSPHVGTSPRNLIATTVGDELKNAGYPSRVVSISLKDRAAILMGGHRADLALWLDPASFRWVSSKYYLPRGELPRWVEQLNAGLKVDKGRSYEWSPDQTIGSGLSASSGFPYRTTLGSEESLSFPYGNQITERAVEAAIREYRLGSGKSTDLLAVSFSSHDYLGHRFGPNSREMEEMTLADDAVVSRLVGFVKSRLPLKDVVFALTADHGIPPVPDWLRENRLDAGRVDQAALVARLEGDLTGKFGQPKEGKWIPYVDDFNFYVDPRAVGGNAARMAVVEREIKDRLAEEPWVAAVFTAADYERGRLPPGMRERQILHTYYPGRSGDVIAIPKPYWIPLGDNASHLTGYAYDRTVPLILTGDYFKTGLYPAGAAMIDLAPTLSYLTGTIAPDLSEGRVLSEALAR